MALHLLSVGSIGAGALALAVFDMAIAAKPNAPPQSQALQMLKSIDNWQLFKGDSSCQLFQRLPDGGTAVMSVGIGPTANVIVRLWNASWKSLKPRQTVNIRAEWIGIESTPTITRTVTRSIDLSASALGPPSDVRLTFLLENENLIEAFVQSRYLSVTAVDGRRISTIPLGSKHAIMDLFVCQAGLNDPFAK